MHRVEDTIGAPQPLAVTEHLPEAAVRYADERHWDVFPGSWLDESGGVQHCSCGFSGCPAPGAHPTHTDWPGQATGSGVAVRRMWSKEPRASVLLPTGRSFDAIDVPEVAGCLALARMERMELPLGPVLCTPNRRLVFFVLPGASAKVPDTVRRLGWLPSALDMVVRGDGDYVAAPPTRMGRGSVQWARQPTALNRWLPDAEELISPLAYACGREAAAQRNR
ncbi:bifunctional DNA primase/polymerase [Streptantibioticus ferralitis]